MIFSFPDDHSREHAAEFYETAHQASRKWQKIATAASHCEASCYISEPLRVR